MGQAMQSYLSHFCLTVKGTQDLYTRITPESALQPEKSPAQCDLQQNTENGPENGESAQTDGN